MARIFRLLYRICDTHARRFYGDFLYKKTTDGGKKDAAPIE